MGAVRGAARLTRSCSRRRTGPALMELDSSGSREMYDYEICSSSIRAVYIVWTYQLPDKREDVKSARHHIITPRVAITGLCAKAGVLHESRSTSATS